MTPETINTPPAITPLADDLGNSSRPWFLYFTALTRRLGVLRDAVMGWSRLTHQDRVVKVTAEGTVGEAAFRDTDVVLGALSLTNAGAIPKVSATAGTLTESALTDNGATVSSTEPVEVTGMIRAMSTAGVAPAAGKGIEMRYNSGTDRGVLVSIDRATATYKRLVLDAADVLINISGATVLTTDATGANVVGVYKVAGTQVVTARQADAGAAASSPAVSTNNTAQTADGVYSANEQLMLNDLKSSMGTANTSLLALETAINALILDRDRIRTVLQAHGLMA
jgi:hypothetical protein